MVERASPTRDEQTDVNTKKPASVCILPLHYIYTVNARYAEPAFGRLTTRAINDISWIRNYAMESWLNLPELESSGKFLYTSSLATFSMLRRLLSIVKVGRVPDLRDFEMAV